MNKSDMFTWLFLIGSLLIGVYFIYDAVNNYEELSNQTINHTCHFDCSETPYMHSKPIINLTYNIKNETYTKIR